MGVSLLLQRRLSTKIEALTAGKFVEMTTLGGGKVLRLDDKVRSLKAGKIADIIAIDISEAHEAFGREPYPLLVYWANYENVVMTMVDGKVLYQNGNFYSRDFKKVLSETSETCRVKEKIFS